MYEMHRGTVARAVLSLTPRPSLSIYGIYRSRASRAPPARAARALSLSFVSKAHPLYYLRIRYRPPSSSGGSCRS